MSKFKIRTMHRTFYDEVIEASNEEEAREKYEHMFYHDEIAPIEDYQSYSWDITDVKQMED